MKALKVLVLTKYGRLGASSRLRSLQYLPWFDQSGVNCVVSSLLSDCQVESLYAAGRYPLGSLFRSYIGRLRALLSRHQFDVVWIEKEALPWLPAWFERQLLSGTPYILDYDDAIFHNYDKHSKAWVRQIFGRRIDQLMKGARLVVGGNSYLAKRARDARAPWVEIMPTVIDLERYAPKTNWTVQAGAMPCIVWIGSPSTVRYLQLLREPLQSLGRELPFKIRVIGGGEVDLPGVKVESLSCSETSEVECIRECDVGVMPLFDSPWESGKCGYKLIQYMACGLPVVASAVGVNPEIVRNGESGYLATGVDEWVGALGKLLRDAMLRAQMGSAGRNRVEQHYCVQQTAPKLIAMLRVAAADKG